MKPLGYHVDLGVKLSALRRQGVLVVGSGNIVHNLGRVDRTHEASGFDWAQRFNQAAMACLLESPGMPRHSGSTPTSISPADRVPTPDHLTGAPVSAAAGPLT